MKRRDFLLGFFAGLATSAVLVFASLPFFGGFTDKVKRTLLRFGTRRPESARLIGERYLQLFPDEAQEQVLIRGILGTDEINSFSAFRAWLDKRRSADFERGDTVIIDGWVLSRSEARLYALFALQ